MDPPKHTKMIQSIISLRINSSKEIMSCLISNNHCACKVDNYKQFSISTMSQTGPLGKNMMHMFASLFFNTMSASLAIFMAKTILTFLKFKLNKTFYIK